MLHTLYRHDTQHRLVLALLSITKYVLCPDYRCFRCADLHRPSLVRPAIFSARARKQRRIIEFKYGLVFLIGAVLAAALIALPVSHFLHYVPSAFK